MVHFPKVRVLNNVNNNGLRIKRQPPRDTNQRKKSYLKYLFLAVFFSSGLLINGDIHPLVKRGFFCNDSSILYPYKTDTVGIKTLMLLALVLPGLLISYCDKKLKLNLRKINPPPSVYDLAKYRLNRRRVSGPQGEVTVEEEELMTQVKRRNYTIREEQDEEDILKETEFNSVDGEKVEGNSELSDQNNAISDIQEANSGSDSDDDSDAEISLFTRIPLKDMSLERKRDYLKASPRVNQNKRPSSSTNNSFGEFQLFFFGLCCTIFITGLGKITGGRLRPHFIDRCRPNVNCLLPENGNRYIQDFTCQNLGPKEYPYITTSWPSGHASIIFYSMLYLILYLNSVIPIFQKLSPAQKRWRYNPIFQFILYLFMVALAFWVAVTRVSDYHHHAVDVASGTVIGTLIAITLSRLYSKPSL